MADKLMRVMGGRGQGLYALAQPHLEGRRVAELWPEQGGAPETLRQMGAREVFVEAPLVAPLPFADGALDVVVCPSFPPDGSDEAADVWLAELARVLAPDGWCVLRVPVGLLGDDDGDAHGDLAAEQGEGSDFGGTGYEGEAVEAMGSEESAPEDAPSDASATAPASHETAVPPGEEAGVAAAVAPTEPVAEPAASADDVSATATEAGAGATGGDGGLASLGEDLTPIPGEEPRTQVTLAAAELPPVSAAPEPAAAGDAAPAADDAATADAEGLLDAGADLGPEMNPAAFAGLGDEAAFADEPAETEIVRAGPVADPATPPLSASSVGAESDRESSAEAAPEPSPASGPAVDRAAALVAAAGDDGHPLARRRRAWQRFVEGIFPAVDVIEEVGFGGVSFRIAGTDDLAIVGDLSPLDAAAEFEIVMVARDANALPRLGESLLVPLPLADAEGAAAADEGTLNAHDERLADALAAEALARAEALHATEAAERIRRDAERARQDAERARREADRARDEARLAAAAGRDREAVREATIASLREGAERQWRRIAEIEATLARITSERDEAVRRAQTAEASIREMETALRRREWEVASLDRDRDRDRDGDGDRDRYGRALAPKG